MLQCRQNLQLLPLSANKSRILRQGRQQVLFHPMKIGGVKYVVGRMSYEGGESNNALSRSEAFLHLPPATTLKRRSRSQRFTIRNNKHNLLLDRFRRIVKSIIILRCWFKARIRFYGIPVQFGNMIMEHRERLVKFSLIERSSLSVQLQMALTTPPKLRKEQDLRKVVTYLRASGAKTSMLGEASSREEMELARYITYERYGNGRVIAQQGRTTERLYFVISGHVMVIEEYTVGDDVIPNGVHMMGKGTGTSVNDMMEGKERTQGLICHGPVEMFALDRMDYFRIRRDKTNDAREYIASHPLFKLFPTDVLQSQTNYVKLNHYPNGSVVYQSGEDYNWIYIVKSGVCGMCRWQMVPNLQHKKKSLSNTDSSKQSEMTEVECVALERAKFRVEQSELMRSRSSSSTTNYLRNDSIRPGTFDDLNKTWNFEDKEDHNEVFSFYTHLLKNKSTNDMDYTLLSTVKENNFRTKPSPKHGEADELIEIKSNLKRLSSIYSKDHYKTTRIKSSISILSKSSSSGSFLKRSVPPMRRAFLEVGKLTVGGVYGLHDEIGTTEEPMEISLVSYGAEVVVIHRNFFLRHAPADLLSKLSWTNQEVPSKKEAGETLKIIETWNMYKTALLNQLSPSTKSSRTKEENVDMTTTSKLSATQSDKTKKRREVLRRTVSAAHFTSKFDYKQYRPCSMPHIK